MHIKTFQSIWKYESINLYSVEDKCGHVDQKVSKKLKYINYGYNQGYTYHLSLYMIIYLLLIIVLKKLLLLPNMLVLGTQPKLNANKTLFAEHNVLKSPLCSILQNTHHKFMFQFRACYT